MTENQTSETKKKVAAFKLAGVVSLCDNIIKSMNAMAISAASIAAVDDGKWGQHYAQDANVFLKIKAMAKEIQEVARPSK